MRGKGELSGKWEMGRKEKMDFKDGRQTGRRGLGEMVEIGGRF